RQEPTLLVEDVRGFRDHPAYGEPLLQGGDQPAVLLLGQLRGPPAGVDAEAVQERSDRVRAAREASHERVDAVRERLADGRAEQRDPRPSDDERTADRL